MLKGTFLQDDGSVLAIELINGIKVARRIPAGQISSNPEVATIVNQLTKPGENDPDWTGWRVAMLSDPAFQYLIANLEGQSQNLWATLQPILWTAGNGDTSILQMIAGLWTGIIASANILPATLEHLAEIAEDYNLPAPFIAVINPPA